MPGGRRRSHSAPTCAAWTAALAGTKVVVRGPKPLVPLRELKVRVDLQAPEPNTWHEVLAALDAQLPVAGQRVAKVMATLTFIENHVTRLLDEIKRAPSALRRNGNQDLHGPRLDFDDGHASQGDIDVMFADD